MWYKIKTTLFNRFKCDTRMQDNKLPNAIENQPIIQQICICWTCREANIVENKNNPTILNLVRAFTLISYKISLKGSHFLYKSVYIICKWNEYGQSINSNQHLHLWYRPANIITKYCIDRDKRGRHRLLIKFKLCFTKKGCVKVTSFFCMAKLNNSSYIWGAFFSNLLTTFKVLTDYTLDTGCHFLLIYFLRRISRVFLNWSLENTYYFYYLIQWK